MDIENDIKEEAIDLPETTEDLGSVFVQPKEENGKVDLINLQMVMVSSSMNHEYVRKEYESTKSYSKKQELMVKMTSLKNLYFTARKKMEEASPERLSVLEGELRVQKTQALSDVTLH